MAGGEVMRGASGVEAFRRGMEVGGKRCRISEVSIREGCSLVRSQELEAAATTGAAVAAAH